MKDEKPNRDQLKIIEQWLRRRYRLPIKRTSGLFSVKPKTFLNVPVIDIKEKPTNANLQNNS